MSTPSTTTLLPPLVTAPRLAAFPDGPFDDDHVDAACDEVRAEVGWHVAPLVADLEVVVSGPRGPRLVLPSLRVTAVTAVHDVATGTPVLGWRVGAAGMLIRDGGWPAGEDNLLVTMTSGFDEAPPRLLPVVAERARAIATPPTPGERSGTRTRGAITDTWTWQDAPAAWSPAATSILDGLRV